MRKITLLLIGALSIGSLSAQTHELWGMTKLGGVNNTGTIFKTDVDGNNQSVQYEFLPSNSNEGIKPTSKLMQASNGKLYGLTPEGGALYQGVLFEYDIVTSTYTMKYDFEQNNWNGDLPFGSLIEASNGKLYGTTVGGGGASGVLFEYDIPTDTYTVKASFDGPILGSSPYCTLVEANNGKLYGTTNGGGVNNDGVIFEYDIALDTLIKKFDFNNSVSGKQPWEGLTIASNGKLYGLTRFGGASGHGVLYEYDPVTNVYTKKVNLHAFTKGGYPEGRLIEASNGKLYGLTKGGGSTGSGVLFEYDPANDSYVKKFTFDNTTTGEYPHGGLVESNNGKLYGMTYTGGANSIGVLFEYDPSTNTYTKKLDFDGATTGSYPRGSLIDVVINGGTTAITENEMLNQISLYPNPAIGQLNIDAHKEIASVTISNLLGKQMLNKTINANSAVLNIEDLPKGIYIVNMQFKEGNLTKKIIVE